MIRFTCPTCGTAQHALDDRAGGSATCKQCGDAVRIPGAAIEDPPAPVRPGAIVGLPPRRIGIAAAAMIISLFAAGAGAWIVWHRQKTEPVRAVQVAQQPGRPVDAEKPEVEVKPASKWPGWIDLWTADKRPEWVDRARHDRKARDEELEKEIDFAGMTDTQLKERARNKEAWEALHRMPWDSVERYVRAEHAAFHPRYIVFVDDAWWSRHTLHEKSDLAQSFASFFKAALGRERAEIRSARSGMALGHSFP